MTLNKPIVKPIKLHRNMFGSYTKNERTYYIVLCGVCGNAIKHNTSMSICRYCKQPVNWKGIRHKYVTDLDEDINKLNI